MTMRMMTTLVVASMLVSGCGKDKKMRTVDHMQHNDQQNVAPSTSTLPDRDQKASVRDRENQSESKQARPTPPKESKRNSPTDKPLAKQKQEEQTAALSPGKEERKAKKAESVTPLDQSESEADIAVTQRIRQALLREDLSFSAKNVLVITEADHVVLKGKVRSPSEAERVKGIAATITTKRIEDVLEVTP